MTKEGLQSAKKGFMLSDKEGDSSRPLKKAPEKAFFILLKAGFKPYKEAFLCF